MDNMSHISLSLVGSKIGSNIALPLLCFAVKIELFHKICGL